MSGEGESAATKQLQIFFSQSKRHANMSMNLDGNIFVTGTNRGIGLELVKQLARKTGQKSHVYACCRKPEGTGAEALRQLATQYPGKITIIKLDVSDEASVSAAVQTVSECIGDAGLNLLINNAGMNRPHSPAPLAETEKKDMMDVFETNVTGPFLLAKMLLPLLQKAAEKESSGEGDKMSCRRSAIINISTLISSMENLPQTFALAQMYPYRASKAALNMVTRCQAEDFRSHNILVAAIHPGWVLTDMGGEHAPMTTEDSVLSMFSVMSSLSNKDSGMFLDYEGNRIPW